jgi:predicted short-subunit dehydrogenase-like oxidoreductase (DUF2520 family)
LIRKGQGPHSKSLLLVGAGRLARHFQFYFQHQDLKLETWSRQESLITFHDRLQRADRVALAISDSAIATFAEANLKDFKGTILHFSGALDLPGTVAAHPLMSFGNDLYPLDFYQQIHFTLTGAEHLADLLPGLPNPFSILQPQDKGLYHALCVLGGNFPVLLWHKMSSEFERLGLPPEAAKVYIKRVADNYLKSGAAALTGPLQRGDQITIDKNLSALEDDPWGQVYKAFTEAVK